MNKKALYIAIFIYFIFSLFIYNYASNYIHGKEKSLLNEKYSSIANNMKKSLSSLIDDKKNATLAIAISASKDNSIKEAILSKYNSKVNFKEFSNNLNKETRFKNVWFQILDKEGQTIYRSWTKHINESLLFRPDVQKVLKEKITLASISVGKFDMTFKSMVPIFEKGEIIGIFEVITHFNSIAKSLEKDNIDSIMLADKSFKSRLSNPFTKKFINDYYVANLNAKKEIVDILEEENIENILKINDYKLIKDSILTTFEIIEFDDKKIGYVILTKKLNTINNKEIEIFRQSSLAYVIIFIIIIGFLFIIVTNYSYFLRIKRLNKKLEKKLEEIRIQEKEKKIILDSQKNIIIITDGKNLQNANKEFLNFYSKFKSIEEFKSVHKCICETFVEIKDDPFYLVDKDYDGNNWAEHILNNQDKNFKAAIYKDTKLHHFTLNVNATHFDNMDKPYIVITLTDISYEIEQNIKNKEKDKILFQQSKMASMGEMLENIAHQWRQPLNAIAAAASTLKLQKKLDLVDDSQVDTSCEFILKNTYYLSQTIEDFKTFFRQDKEKKLFNLKDSISEDINLIKDKLKHNNIEIIVDIDSKVEIFGFKNEFQQAILNILNNSIDAFILKNIENRRVILINYKDNSLEIVDSAKGVEESILNKIFEPYFTTKHQSQGTGIGLYMSEEILTRHMNCKVTTKNHHFEYENKSYFGLLFKITFNNQ